MSGMVYDSNRFALRREIANHFPPGCTVLKSEEQKNVLTMGRVVSIAGEIDAQPFTFVCDERGDLKLTVGSIVFAEGKGEDGDSPVKLCGEALHRYKASLAPPTPEPATRTDIVKDSLTTLVADIRRAADGIEAALKA